MKSRLRNLSLTAALACGGLLPLLSPAQAIWNTSSGNWSTPGNWNPSGVPGSTTSVLFTNNTGAATSAGTIDNTVDSGFGGYVGSLQYANTNSSGVAGGFYHTTQIGAGQTLTIYGNLTANTFTDMGGKNQVNAAITGEGSLVVSNGTGNILVSQGSATSGCSATMNLTNLNTLTAYIGGIGVGLYNTPDATLARELGFLFLARTNNLNFIGNAPRAYGNEGQIALGENLGNGGAGSIIYLGIANNISVNTISIVGDKQSGGLLSFNPVFTNTYTPYLVIGGTNGPGSRVTSWTIADNSGQTTSGSGCNGTNDFTGGILNALVNTMTIGKSESGASTGAGSGTGVFTFSAGTNDVNNLYLGYRVATGGNSVGNGTMNVNGTAMLVVNNAICLSYWNGGSSSAAGTGALNINGGAVLANTITNGINVSVANNNANITLNNGVLGITSITGVAGSLAAPVENFNLSGSTLQLDVSGVQTNVEAINFNPSGTTNWVSFSYLPPVNSYPATYPLIGFQSLGGTLNIGISNFPAASPAYQGYITNDANTVYVVLTAGPTIGSSLDVWTGAHGTNWDTSTLNWTSFGNPATFANGTPVQFDDTASGPTTVNLTSTELPASVTASNSVLAYAFNGPGKLSGGTGITKWGTGSLTVANSGNNDFVGPVTINAGTLQFGNGSTNGNLPAAVSVTDNGSLVFDHSDNLVIPNAIAGTGSLVLDAPSVLTLTASNEFDGETIVSNGTLLVDGSLNGTLTNTASGVIGGGGTNFGSVMVSGMIEPSAISGVPTTFTAGDLTALPGGTLGFSLNGTDNTIGNGVNDLLQAGNLTVNNNVISLGFLSVPQIGAPYTVITYSGSLTGSFNPVVAGTHFGASIDTSSPGYVNVTMSGSGANLKWNSTSSAIWTSGGTSNWLNLASSQQDVFYAGDNVLFDDSVPGVMTNVTIATGVTVSPASLTNNSSAENYTIGGAGHIAGAGVIVKGGTSTLSLNTANNNFSGSVMVQGGALRMGNNEAFGSGTVNISSGATLDLNGGSPGAVLITAEGAGVGGSGAIVNSGADQIHAVQNLALAGDTTFGGPGRWDLRYNGANNASLSSADGNPYNLTKVGNNLVALVDCTVDQSLGNIDIQGGSLGLQLNTLELSPSWAADATHTITVEAGAELGLDLTSATPLGKNLVFKDESTFENDGTVSYVNGPITLQGTVTNVISTVLEIDSAIVGPGSLVLVGGSTLTLTATNTFEGSTYVDGGTLALSGSGNLSGSSNIVIAAGQKLDVSARTDDTLTLAAGQTLLGNGVVNGMLSVSPGATVSAGADFNSIGILTVSNNVSLDGTTYLKLNAATGTNDVLVSTGSFTYGGTLTVANLGGSFTAGQTFQLFSAASAPTGSFSTLNLPAPGAGLGWSNNLAAAGRLIVVSVAPPVQPFLTSVSLSGGSLVISGTNGTVGQSFSILSSTNLTTPLSQWTLVGTNTFGGASFSITNAVSPAALQNFYLLRVP